MLHENRDRATERLRQIIPLISKHKIAATPRNYAVLYHYVAGYNQTLTEILDRLLRQSSALDEAILSELHDRFVDGGRKFEEQSRMQDSLSRIMERAVSQVSRAHQQASSFDQSLDRHGKALAQSQGADSAAGLLKLLRSDTEEMARASGAIEEQLRQTSDEVQELRKELAKARQTAQFDSLTGLRNRGSFDAALKAAMAKPSSERTGCCLLLLDIDHFKSINDSFGHLVGDRVICFVAKLLKRRLAAKYHVARYGGEEFAAILPGVSGSKALDLAEGILKELASSSLQLKNRGESLGKVTLSCGIALLGREDSLEDFIERADRCLYQAKVTGRNRVVTQDSLLVDAPDRSDVA